MLIFNPYTFILLFVSLQILPLESRPGDQNLDWCFSCVVIAAPSNGKKIEQKDDGLPVDIKLPIKHVLSRELQVYAIYLFFLLIYLVLILQLIEIFL